MTGLNETRPFGRTGVEITPLILGTSSWGPLRRGEATVDRDRRIGAMMHAVVTGEVPINAVDTSNTYGDSKSEASIGRVLREIGGLPEGILVQSKLDRDPATGDFSADRMWRSLEESLERLGLERIQVLYLHDPEHIGFETAMAPGGPAEALLQMKARGLSRFVGISGGPVDMLLRFVETGEFDALVTHNRYTVVDRSAEGLIQAATRRSMGIMNAAPYGAGVLTGDPRFAGRYAYSQARPEVTSSIDAMRAACADAGVPLAAAALQFGLRDSRVHGTIVGASSIDRISSAVEHASVDIPEDLWAQLDTLVPPASVALDQPR